MNEAIRPWLSVLVPVYNVEAYLTDCVQSILTQDVRGVEILLLDDIGTDSSPEIMRSLAQAHPNTIKRFAHTHNRGLAAARNTLLTHAKGEYVWFLDSDDLLADAALATLKQAIQTHVPDLILCDFSYLYEKARLAHWLRGSSHRRTFASAAELPIHNPEKLFNGLLRAGELHAWSKIAKREVWQSAPFPEGRFFEDIPTIPALVRSTQKFLHVRKPLVRYRQRQGSILASYNEVKLQDLLASLLELNQATRKLQAEFGIEINKATENFCMRTIASAARRIGRIKALHQKEKLLQTYRDALTQIFPDGVESLFSRWLKDGWWIRLLRIRSRLKNAGVL